MQDEEYKICPKCGSSRIKTELAFYDGETGTGGVDIFCEDCDWVITVSGSE
jgi:hypothetical protein